MAIGLQTQIWHNQVKSLLLLAGFPVLLLAILFVAAMAMNPMGADPVSAGVDGVLRYGHWAFLGAAGWFVIAYLSHERMIRAATHSRELTREEAPEIYNMVENLCISRGLPTPKLGLMDSPVMNAFASGIDQKSFSITLTTGIIAALETDELETVLAHELTHIINRDVRVMVIAVIFVGIISFLCQWLGNLRFFGGGSERRNNGAVMLLLMLVVWVGYLLATVVRLAISRSREYLADAGAVELTKNPDGLIRALRKISGNADLPAVPAEMRQMMFENGHGFAGEMFATHPPIEKRIAALVMMGGDDRTPLAAPASAAPADGPWSRIKRGPWGAAR